ncbi:MAG: hypothetical protein HY547_07790, partial [Elusimicrobia bacterium]|nr:hypothetical protein [Elusimicrobiota bacterium]
MEKDRASPRVCDFLLDSLKDPPLKTLRLLDLLTLYDFIQYAGDEPFQATGPNNNDDRGRRRHLATELASSLKNEAPPESRLYAYAYKFKKMVK